MKPCVRCGGENKRECHSYCNLCHAANMRATRPKHRELPDDARKKANARSYANVFLRRGKIIKQPCEICGNPNSEKHHDDYSKPAEVRWLCRKHHLEHHKKLKTNATENLSI